MSYFQHAAESLLIPVDKLLSRQQAQSRNSSSVSPQSKSTRHEMADKESHEFIPAQSSPNRSDSPVCISHRYRSQFTSLLLVRIINNVAFNSATSFSEYQSQVLRVHRLRLWSVNHKCHEHIRWRNLAAGVSSWCLPFICPTLR